MISTFWRSSFADSWTKRPLLSRRETTSLSVGPLNQRATCLRAARRRRRRSPPPSQPGTPSISPALASRAASRPCSVVVRYWGWFLIIVRYWGWAYFLFGFVADLRFASWVLVHGCASFLFRDRPISCPSNNLSSCDDGSRVRSDHRQLCPRFGSVIAFAPENER